MAGNYRAEKKLGQTPVSELYLVESKVLWVKILPDVEQSLESAKENLDTVARVLAENDMSLVLLDLREAQPLDFKVRKYYVEGEQLLGIKFLGLVVNSSPFGRVLGNTYLKVASTTPPKMLFGDFERAVKWLANYA